MVAQPAFYFRFDVREWINPDTSKVENYYDFVERYDITEQVISYTIVSDIDYKPDIVSVVLKKTFFTNPYNLEEYTSSIDPINSFSPANMHVIAIGPFPFENGNEVESDMFFGVLQNVQDLGQNKVQMEAWSFLKTLIDVQGENRYKFNRIDTSSETDSPNSPRTFYEDFTYSQISGEYDNSDVVFAPKDVTTIDKFPYAVYTIDGSATADGTLTIKYNLGGDDQTVIYNFLSGHTGEYIAEQFSHILQPIFDSRNSHIYNKYPSNGTPSFYIDTASEIRVTFLHNAIVFENMPGYTHYIREVKIDPIISTDVGIKTNYIYIGKTSVENNKPPEDGRGRIYPLKEDSNIEASKLPLFPLNVYNTQLNGSEKVRNVFEGYEVHKIAWRILNRVGWCREPFFDAMNPYSLDYSAENIDEYTYANDGDLVPIEYTKYQSDGLEVDFMDSFVSDGKTYRSTKTFSSFDASKQPQAYNLKTISDSMSLFLNAGAKPKFVEYLPVWDDTIYNRPNTNIITFFGCVRSEVGMNITFNIAMPLGVETITINNLHDISIKSVVAIIEKRIKEIEGISDVYTIKRYGNTLYLEDRFNTGNPISISISTNSILDTDVSLLYDHYYYNMSDSSARSAERIYYLRRWGIFAGFHPFVQMRQMPTLMLQSPTPDINIVYGGDNARNNTNATNAVVAKPVWSVDSKDIINKVIVNYKSSSSDTISHMVAFPADVKTENYFVIYLDGFIDAVNGIINLVINVDGMIYSGAISTESDTLAKGHTVFDVTNAFNNMILGNESDGFRIYGVDNALYIMPLSSISLKDTTQINLEFENGITEMKVLSKEFVGLEPATFDDARNSQSKYGVKEVSFSLPETVSISDTMEYVAQIFTKYMQPKERVVCEMTGNDSWNLPLFTYANIKDYTNFDTYEFEFDWYKDIYIYDMATLEQNARIVVYTSSEEMLVSSTEIVIGLYDTPEFIANKIAISIENHFRSNDEIFYSAFTENFDNYSVVHIVPGVNIDSIKSPGKPNAIVLDFALSKMRYDVISYDKSTLKVVRAKEKDLVLMRVENSSIKGSYTATFGQPIEEVSNIVNQVNAWVGDVERGITTSTGMNEPDYSNLFVSNWVMVNDGVGSVVLSDGGVNATNIIHTDAFFESEEGLITTGTIFSFGNIGCHFSGTTGTLERLTASEINIPHENILSSKNICLVKDIDIVYLVGSEVGIPITVNKSGTWSFFKKIQPNTDIYAVDASICNNRLYFTYIPRDKTTLRVGYVDLTDSTENETYYTNITAVGLTPDNSKISARYDGTKYIINVVYDMIDGNNKHTLLRMLYTDTLGNIVVSSPQIITYCNNIYSYEIETSKNRFKEGGFIDYYVLDVAISFMALEQDNRTQLYHTMNDVADIIYTDGTTKILSTKSTSERIDNIGITTRLVSAGGGASSSYIYVWGVSDTSNVYISYASNEPGIWSKICLSDIKADLKPYTATGFYYSGVSGVGYAIVQKKDMPSIVSVYKISNPNISTLVESDISLLTTTGSSHYNSCGFEKIVAIDFTKYVGIYVDGINKPTTKFLIYDTAALEPFQPGVVNITTISNGYLTGTLALWNYDTDRDFGEPSEDGVITIKNTGIYSISFSLYAKILTSVWWGGKGSNVGAYLIHDNGSNAKQIGQGMMIDFWSNSYFEDTPSDYFVDSLCVNVSAIKLHKGDKLYVLIKASFKDTHDDINLTLDIPNCYFNMHMLSGLQ